MRLFLRLTAFLGLLTGAAAFGDAVQLTNLWSIDIRTKSDSSAAIGQDGTIYFGTLHGRFYALTPGGSIKWVFQSPLEIKSSPAVATDGTVFFGSRDRFIYCLKPDGSLKWKHKTGA